MTRAGCYKRKLYQLLVFDGRMKWSVSRSSSNLVELVERFDRVTKYDNEFPARDWYGFSWRIINKATGEVIKHHVGRCRKYAREHWED